MAGVLDGMRVIEGSAFVAAPLAGMTLAQMGADVIRFDRLQGGLDARRWPVAPSGESLFWAGLNKGKRSLAVDLSRPEGQEIVAALITAPGPDAGLFLTNLRVRGWMDYPALASRRPDLVMVALLGTRRGEPAVDYTVNPAVGFPTATGPEGSEAPVAHVLPAWDCIAGQMLATGLLAAERRRARGGGGQLVELALKDVAAAMLGNLGILGEAVATGADRPKAGNALYGAFGRDFACAGGRRVMVVGLTDRQWRGLVAATGTGEAMAALGRRLGRDLRREGERWLAREEIAALVEPWFAEREVAEIGPALDAAGVPWSEFRSFLEAAREDPDLTPANPMFTMLDQPGLGRFPVPGTPFAFSAEPRDPPRPAPRLGEHSEAILADVLGLGSGQIGRLMDAGIVAGPRVAANRRQGQTADVA